MRAGGFLPDMRRSLGHGPFVPTLVGESGAFSTREQRRRARTFTDESDILLRSSESLKLRNLLYN